MSSDAGNTPGSKTSLNSPSSLRARAYASSCDTYVTDNTSGNAWMSPIAALDASTGVPSAMNALISTRFSIACNASRIFTATSPNNPNANSENAIVTTPSTLRSGARLNAENASRMTIMPYPGSYRILVVMARRHGVLCLLDRWRLGAVVDETPVVQLDRAIFGAPDQIQIVRRHDDGGAGGVDFAQKLKHSACRALVQIAGRLVRDEHERIVDECAGDCDTLLLTARKLARQRGSLGRQADLREYAAYSLPYHVGGRAGHFESEGDIRFGRSVFQQTEVLEHDSEMASHHRHFLPGCVASAHTVDPHVASGWALLHVDQLEDRGLARSARTREEGELALVQLKRCVTQRDAAARVFLRDVEKPYQTQPSATSRPAQNPRSGRRHPRVPR